MENKVCTCCGECKPITEYHKNKDGKNGYRNQCKDCRSKKRRKHYIENIEHARAVNNRWKRENPERRAAYQSNRRALKHALPYSTSADLWLDVIATYDFKCAVTGKDKFDLEHMIPISIGWGGSLKNNIYPLCSELNSRKSAKNPYKFLKELQGQQRTNFEKVLHNLAKENGLTYKEYKKFVNWCFKHPRTLEEVLEDNKLGLTDVELWKLRTEKSN